MLLSFVSRKRKQPNQHRLNIRQILRELAVPRSGSNYNLSFLVHVFVFLFVLLPRWWVVNILVVLRDLRCFRHPARVPAHEANLCLLRIRRLRKNQAKADATSRNRTKNRTRLRARKSVREGNHHISQHAYYTTVVAATTTAAVVSFWFLGSRRSGYVLLHYHI